MSDLMREIRGIYQRWLDGDLSQEDAMFDIGDVLGAAAGGANGDAVAEERPAFNPAISQKGA